MFNKKEFLKRLKSFAWRLGGYGLVALLAFISSSLDLFNLPPGVVVVVGYVLNEITKWLNKEFNLEGKALGVVHYLAGR